jgi:hypothetical protein
VGAVFEVLQEISEHLTKKSLDYLYKKLKNIAPVDHNEQSINLIQKFSV